VTDFAARLLYWTASLLARLPWAWLRGMADAFARAWIGRNDRTERVVRRNLELAYPELLPAQRESLVGAVMRTTARQGVETLRFWTQPHAKNLALLRETHGVEMFDAAVASGHGVIVAAPHYGSWELLNQWLASRTPLAILYAPPESEVAEAFLRRVRAAHGDAGRVTQVRAEGPAIRGLFKLLQGGGVAGILPDQQPKAGDGEFAPFFGIPALTMTLLSRLAQRTGATVLLGYCERIGETPDGPAFALRFEPVPDAADGVAALNAAVERVARRDPAQYQWTYKRWSIPAPGSTRGNPYWPDCYPQAARRTPSSDPGTP
jgi:KDO2-lipid IV(A) lauroyltransferase